MIFDPVGGDYAEAALRSIGWEGRFLVVGFPAGIPKLPLNLTLLKSCDVCGVFWGAFAARDPKRNAAHVEQLFRWWAEGKIAPKVSATYPLERGGEAIAALRDRKAIGKLVVRSESTPLEAAGRAAVVVLERGRIFVRDGDPAAPATLARFAVRQGRAYRGVRDAGIARGVGVPSNQPAQPGSSPVAVRRLHRTGPGDPGPSS